MSKFLDSIKAALAKKQAQHHPDAKTTDGTTTAVKSKTPTPVANKPQKKVTGRGR